MQLSRRTCIPALPLYPFSTAASAPRRQRRQSSHGVPAAHRVRPYIIRPAPATAAALLAPAPRHMWLLVVPLAAAARRRLTAALPRRYGSGAWRVALNTTVAVYSSSRNTASTAGEEEEELESGGCPEQKVSTGSGEVPDGGGGDQLVAGRTAAASRADVMNNNNIMCGEAIIALQFTSSS